MSLCGQRPRMSASASSTERSSLAARRPADRPSRSGSTTVVCSTRTRVSCPSSVIVGRKLAGSACAEVGETSVVLRSRNSSAWTTTANRAPRCSCPRTARGAGSRNTSPRTKSARPARCELGHLFSHDSHLFAVLLVGRDTADLLAERRASAASCRCFAKGSTHGLRVREAVRAHNLERSRRRVVQPNVERSRHRGSVAQNVLRHSK